MKYGAGTRQGFLSEALRIGPRVQPSVPPCSELKCDASNSSVEDHTTISTVTLATPYTSEQTTRKRPGLGYFAEFCCGCSTGRQQSRTGDGVGGGCHMAAARAQALAQIWR